MRRSHFTRALYPACGYRPFFAALAVHDPSVAFTRDLEPYDYTGAPHAVAVGWLDEAEPFMTGSCPADVYDWLRELAKRPQRLMRGYHYCQWCLTAQTEFPKVLDPEPRLTEPPDVARGNGEVWVADSSGTNFAAPVLIVHYIEAHEYR